MKKTSILGLFLLITGAFAQAQILQPVTWSYAAKRFNKNEVTVYLKATMEPGWHIYSTQQKEGGPIKTSFEFDKKGYQLIGTITEPKPVSKFEKAFEMDVMYFDSSVVFSQKVRLPGSGTVRGNLTYMTCNDQKCLPPETIAFSVPVK